MYPRHVIQSGLVDFLGGEVQRRVVTNAVAVVGIAIGQRPHAEAVLHLGLLVQQFRHQDLRAFPERPAQSGDRRALELRIALRAQLQCIQLVAEIGQQRIFALFSP